MALTFQVCQLRQGSATLRRESTGALEKTQRTHQTSWEVIATGIADPSEVDEVMAAQATGLPSIGSSVYVDKQTGQVYPYFFCDSKSATRDPSNGYRFEVRCTYKDDSGDEDPQDPPADPENLCPVISFSSGDSQSTAWGAVLNDGSSKPFRLPTGDPYEQALTERIGVLTVSHTQYENTFNESVFQSRIMKVNSDTYRGYAAGGAMVTSINWSLVNVPISAGGFVSSYKVQYTIECLARTYKTLTDTATLPTHVTTETAGHHVLRVRSSDRFLTAANDLSTVVSNVSANPDDIGPCFIKPDGTRYVNAVQGTQADAPPIDRWMPQEEISFSFLRSCP